MRQRLLLLSAAISTLAAAQSTFTTHYDLEKPRDGSTNWGPAIRDAFDTIDAQMYSNQTTTDAHIADTTGAHAASAISTVPGTETCTIETTVQAFLECLDTQFGAIVGGTAATLAGNNTFTGTNNFTVGLVVSGGSIDTPLTEGVVKSSPIGILSSSAVVDADISPTAAITRSKLATGSPNHVVIHDGSGNLSSEATLAISRGGTGSATQNFVDLTTNQTIGGQKTFSNIAQFQSTLSANSLLNIHNGGELRGPWNTDTTAGVITALGTTGHVCLRLTAATTVQGLANGANGDFLFLLNANTVDLTLENEAAAATAANRIAIEGGSNRVLRPNGVAVLIYSSDISRWVLLSGGGASAPTVQTITGTSVTLTTDAQQKIRYNGASVQTLGTITIPAGLPDGAKIEFTGLSSTNTLLINNNNVTNGWVLNGSVELGQYDTIIFSWDSGGQRLVEVSRNE